MVIVSFSAKLFMEKIIYYNGNQKDKRFLINDTKRNEKPRPYNPNYFLSYKSHFIFVNQKTQMRLVEQPHLLKK